MSLRDDILHDCAGLCDESELGYALTIKPQGSSDSATWITGITGLVDPSGAAELLIDEDMPIAEQTHSIVVTIPRSQLAGLGRGLMSGDVITFTDEPYSIAEWTIDQPNPIAGFEQPTCTRGRPVGGGYAGKASP